jgi:DNA-binding MarR family transcriptional regulator
MPQKADFLECDSCLCFAARRAARTITQHFERHLRSSGLRATQFTLLVMLVRAGALSMNALADHLGMERTTLTRNLRPLMAQGYVALEEGEEDRRVKKISITDAGRAAAEAALPEWRKVNRAMARRLPAEALRIFQKAGRVA